MTTPSSHARIRSGAKVIAPIIALAGLGSFVQPSTAIAAAQTMRYGVDSPVLTKAQAGSRLVLTLDVNGSGTLDCSSVALTLAKDPNTFLPIDWKSSGCWKGGVRLTTTVPAEFAGQQVRLSGDATGLTSTAAARSTVGTGAATKAPLTTGAVPAAAPKTFTMSATTTGAGTVGQTVRVAIDATAASIDCASATLAYQDASGAWKPMSADAAASGCWSGGIVKAGKHTAQSAGRPVRLQARASRTSEARLTLVARQGINGQTRLLRTAVAPATGTTSPAATAAPEPSTDATAKPSASATSKPSASAMPTPAPAPSTGTVTTLSLPRIPWEGGADYYKQFPSTVKAGWTDKNHFPIAVWWGAASSDGEMQYDKKQGINTYVVTNPNADPDLFTRNGMDYVGHALKGMDRNHEAWVGDYLDDEVDGRFTAAEGQAHLKKLSDALPDHSKPRYANFTGMVISWFGSNPAWDTASKNYVNNYTDMNSIDAYWFSSEQCDWKNPNGFAYMTTFTKDNCRSSQAYGRTTKSLRLRDAQDGKLQPNWNFIENVDVAADGESFHDLTPAEVKGAAMSTLINEARGLIWFNNSFGGKCSTGNALRASQNASYACRDTVLAMGEINRFVQSLAPVLNTQSYEWNFGEGLETMLKVHDGSAYVFAMSTDDRAAGSRTFTVPAELKGRTVEVVGENRTIKPKADGTFTDSFATLDSYHVYKIS